MRNSLKLKNFPISFFAPVLGLAGFSLAIQRVESLFSIPSWVFPTVLGLTLFLFVLVLAIYFMKLIVFKSEIIKEYRHPIKINFFPLIPKIMLVLSVVFLGINMEYSKYLWVGGLIINTFFSLSILGEWITKEHFKIHHMNPAWFIPVVGNLIIPIAGVQHFHPEISWFFFSIGIVWMFILTIIVLNRLIFHDPMEKKLLPTLFILFAAPAIAFIAYYKLTDTFDSFARILYYFSAFLFFLITFQWKLFMKIEFYLSWWAYTFPLAAFSLGTILMYHITELEIFKYLNAVVLAALFVFILGLLYRTLKAISKKQICIEE